MITEDERFIKIQGILAMSDIHPADCIKINDLIIELSKENQKLRKEMIDKKYEILTFIKENKEKIKYASNIDDDCYSYVSLDEDEITTLERIVMNEYDNENN